MVDQRKSEDLPPKSEWKTPLKVFHAIEKFTYKNYSPPFAEHFELDPCTTADNPLGTKRFYTKKEDGLWRDWAPYSVFCNPPYDNIPAWLNKAVLEANKDEDEAKVCMLLPAATADGWFHDLATLGKITLLKGRVSFENAPTSPRWGSILVHFFHYRVWTQLQAGIDVGDLHLDSRIRRKSKKEDEEDE
jgi:phage N-6-adenine-methyltransferase